MGKDSELRLSADNLHLKNIFTDNCYIEMGNIEISVIERILKYEMVKLEEVAYFPIQNKGLGKSKIENQVLANILPYLFFENIDSKNQKKQLFLTYGVVKYKNSDKKEVFTPVILLPVKLISLNEEFYIQLFLPPIENPFLFNIFNDSKFFDYTSSKLDTIYEIDRLCMNLSKIDSFELKLENYLTFGNIKRKEVVINQNKFQLASDNNEEYQDRIYIEDKEIYFSDLLNRRQRKAVVASVDNQSFSIMGYGGVGKTTTLKNIAINALLNNKRVLYISNMKETLEDIEHFINELKLSKIIVNLNNPFSSLTFENNNETIEEIEENDFSDLTNKYNYINDFETKMSGRILDYRYIDIVDNLAMLSLKKPEILNLDNLDSLYKHEFLDTINNLERIEIALGKLNVEFKNSIWKGIPIANSVNYPDQIVSLINKINKCFLLFSEEKRILENRFLVSEIPNYGKLRNVVYDLENLDCEKVPDEWKESSLEYFKKAKDEFKNLKNDIYLCQQCEYNLQHKYNNYNDFSIASEVEILFGKYYDENDLTYINTLLENKNSISVRINKGLYQIENNLNARKELSNFANIDYTDNELIDEIVRLTEFLNKNYISRRYMNIINNDQFEKVYNKACKIFESIEMYTHEISVFMSNHPKLSLRDLKNILTMINDYKGLTDKKQSNKILMFLKKKMKINDFSEIERVVFEYFKNIDDLKNAKEEYCDLLKEKYSTDTIHHENLKTLYDYILSIRNLSYRADIIKLLYKISTNETKIPKLLNIFRKSYFEINGLCEILEEYKMKFDANNLLERIFELEEAIDYIKALYLSNERIMLVVKNKDKNYIEAEAYLQLNDLINDRNKIKNKLKNSQKYIKYYGKLYNEENTSITLISKMIASFELFCKSFSSSEGFLNALQKDENYHLLTFLNESKKAFDDINEIFKLYSRIFKDGVSRFYYTNFKEVIEYLEKLLNSKEELIYYLDVAKSLNVIDRYGLNKLVEYIIDTNRHIALKDSFEYTYFKNAQKLYLEENPLLAIHDNLISTLNEIVSLEKKYIEYNEKVVIQKIRKNITSKASFGGVVATDYKDFIKKSSELKKIVLSTSDIANVYLKVEDFDMVIIDDAHLGDANEYGNFVNAKQVIVAGEMQYHSTTSTNLISRVKNAYTIYFDRRYYASPKNLKKRYNLKCDIKNGFYENIGLEIVEEGIYDYIYNLLKTKKDVKINYFTKELVDQRKFFEELSKYLLEKEYTYYDIIDILTNTINVSDLATGYSYNADYNVLDLYSYYDINIDYISENLMSPLLLCKEKLIIYDKKLLLNNDCNYRFYNTIKNILDSRNFVFANLLINDSMSSLNNCIKKMGIDSYCDQENKIVMIKEGLISILYVIWGDNNTSNTLNFYRDNCYNVDLKSSKVKVIVKNSLSSDINDVALKIVRGNNV